MAMKMETEFDARLARHHDELRWLYMELYDTFNASCYFVVTQK